MRTSAIHPIRSIARRFGASIAIASTVIAAGVAVQPAAATTTTFTMPSGTQMVSGDVLRSPSGCFQLEMQSDGNAVAYVANPRRAIWASHTDGHPGAYLRMQTDGNAVVYSGGTPIYATHTDGHSGAYLQMQDDGNVVVYSTNRTALFASHTDIGCPASGSTRDLAIRIQQKPRITLATVHASGVRDNANARQNIADLAAGLGSARSSYGTAPGGRTTVDSRVLKALLDIEARHTLSVSEITGGSHSSGSKHYLGRAVDINVIDGTHVTSSHAGAKDAVNICKADGATLAFIESSNHVHCQW